MVFLKKYTFLSLGSTFVLLCPSLFPVGLFYLYFHSDFLITYTFYSYKSPFNLYNFLFQCFCYLVFRPSSTNLNFVRFQESNRSFTFFMIKCNLKFFSFYVTKLEIILVIFFFPLLLPYFVLILLMSLPCHLSTLFIFLSLYHIELSLCNHLDNLYLSDLLDYFSVCLVYFLFFNICSVQNFIYVFCFDLIEMILVYFTLKFRLLK